MSSNIDHLIINSPYYVPKAHWKYNREKRLFSKMEGRRPAGYLVASSDSQIFDDPGEFRELELVNRIRKRLETWRNNDYQGVTGITKRLLEYWHKTDVRENRLFFCQLEAIETIIWWSESTIAYRQGIVIPSDEGPFERVCSKMATGSGKTLVMAMLFAWQVLNKVTYPTDTRFSKNFLVIAPGITVKKRLEVLMPSSEKNIYNQFHVVPDYLLDKLRQGKILIHNWHTLMPLEETKKSIVKKGEESDESFARRILGDMSRSKNIIVINDEAHHAWRINPNNNLKIDKDELEEATKWIEGLDSIHSARNIIRCYDFSATPFVPSGKNVSDETLFEWIISDFSLNDAIESGLVKTPRIAVRDDSGLFENYRSRFYHIYKDPDVKPNLNRKAMPEDPLPDLVKNAYYLLGQDWLETKKAWAHSKIPPVMITVCNRTETAARVVKSFKRNNFNLDELSNIEKMLHIDSKILREAENMELSDSETNESVSSKSSSLKDFGKKLRETVNTVGKIDEPGQDIQNIIAVSMLSEGWDATNVTHIMGLRAFTSQLLCEQVVGRGLRRMSYEINQKTGLFDPEYVNIFGVPFTFLPHEGQGDSPPPPTVVQTRIEPVSSKILHEISWPNVDRIDRQFSSSLSLDIEKVKELKLEPNEYSLSVDMAEIIEGKPVVSTMSDIDLEKLNSQIRIQWIIFHTAKHIFEQIKPDWKGSREHLMMQLVRIIQEFISSDKIKVMNTPSSEEIRRKFVVAFNMTKIVNHLINEIKFLNTESRKLIFNLDKPILSTSDMQPWYTRKPNTLTIKSHISHAVHDSQWEAAAINEFEKNSNVVSWVKNEHIGFKIFYLYNGTVHEYWPDYLIKLKSGSNLVLEIKGQDSDQNKSKRESLKEWIEAVNQDRRFGFWQWAVAFSTAEVKTILQKCD